MLCARSSRTRSPSRRSSADRQFPLLTPVAAAVSETTKSHHACSAERTDQVTYGGDQARVVVSYCKRTHNVPPVVAVLHRRMHRPLAGAASAFGEGGPLERAAASRFGFTLKSNRAAKMLYAEKSAPAHGKRPNGNSSAEETGVVA